MTSKKKTARPAKMTKKELERFTSWRFIKEARAAAGAAFHAIKEAEELADANPRNPAAPLAVQIQTARIRLDAASKFLAAAAIRVWD